MIIGKETDPTKQSLFPLHSVQQRGRRVSQSTGTPRPFGRTRGPGPIPPCGDAQVVGWLPARLHPHGTGTAGKAELGQGALPHTDSRRRKEGFCSAAKTQNAKGQDKHSKGPRSTGPDEQVVEKVQEAWGPGSQAQQCQ